MAAEIFTIDTDNFDPQGYSGQDNILISSQEVNTTFTTSSYIELNIYNSNKELLVDDLSFSQYTILNDGQSASTGEIAQIIVDPENILNSYGFNQGEYITYFNFFNKQIGSNLQNLYISEISSDRTEIRLDSNNLSELDIIEQTQQFIQQRENSEYFLDFYINFGDNQIYVANNIQLDNDDPLNPTILVKLYNPLPLEFNLKDSLWIVTLLEESRAYQVVFEDEIIEISDNTVKISGPNFNLDLKDQVNNSTDLLSYTDLTTTTLTSSLDQINNLLNKKEIDINVDYTQFSEFSHFSSVQTRLENFYYKVGLIESYSSSISILDNTTSSADTSGSKAMYESKISNIIKNFDGYDYFLYYDSSSYSWPKTTSTKPYPLTKRDTTEVNNWFGSVNENSPYYGGLLLSASLYDNENKDNLKFSIPEYLRDDPDNSQYELFVDMVAQHYDNIWIYHKELTQKYDADNRLEYGISKDIVANAIRDFGLKLYQNNFSNDDLYTAFLGLTPNGGLFPFPNTTGSLPTPTGFEYIDQFISASNDVIPLDDVNKSLYKRIYHNIPYLLKAKGTIPGLRALITSYGIPDTILRINEYGSKDKINVNDWDHWQREFNYYFSTSGSNFVSSSWGLNSNWNATDDAPGTLMFRFNAGNLPTSSIAYSQSLWYSDLGSALTLTYTGSAYTSASYSGSIIDPYYQYATLDFYPDVTEPTVTASVYLPFYNNKWWSVMVTRSGNSFSLYSQNKIYEEGENGTQIGFTASSTITGDGIPWANSSTSYFPVSFSVGTVSGYDVVTYDNTAIYNGTGGVVGTYQPFTGSYQEIRYYTVPISESVFKDYTMNPHSIEGNSINSSPNELAFRASLGGELYTGSVSIHPKVTGSWVATQSFVSDSNFYYDNTPLFLPNTETFFADQPIAGLRNIIKDKIRVENNVIPEGNTLSPFTSLSQMANVSQSYTPGINYLEVAFSPTNEINEDIMDQIGYFNIGDYIGDPRLRSSSAVTYPDLDNLRDDYFEKYTKNYNLKDFIRLIKFFDNSLFKMIKDFVPARTSLASGVVVKQHLLERNKYPQPQMSFENKIYTGSIDMVEISGGAAGVFNEFNGIDNRFGITQSWNETVEYLSGSITTLHDSQDEFYNGEFSGSNLIVTTQSLAQEYPLDFQGFEYTPILYSNSSKYYDVLSISEFSEQQFLDSRTIPNPGEMLILSPYTILIGNKETGDVITKYSDTFIKINKVDCNGKNNKVPLEQITQLLIKYPTNNKHTTYRVDFPSEFPDYFLYKVNRGRVTSSGPFDIDSEIKNYKISASITNPFSLSIPTDPPYNLLPTSSIDLLNYYTSSTGYTTFENTPNIPLIVTSSITLTNASSPTTILLTYSTSDYIDIIATSNFQSLPTGTSTFTISGSFTPLNSNSNVLSLISIPSTTLTIENVEYLITQSTDPQYEDVCDSVILEPYITLPNYFYTDFNPLINNFLEPRIGTLYQDVDYSSGATEPVNFNLIISGSATKAAVQDSNYTLRRSVIPRYEGSKSTSKNLNRWTPGDTGTFGKIPTVESLKTVIAYCDWIGGWPPDRMNASTAHVLYLIDADGNIGVPNTSENSLPNVQGAFQTGERFRISSRTIGSGEPDLLRTVIRGGSRIEPILYTQIGKQPGAEWTSSINLVDIEATSGSATSDYQNQGSVLQNSVILDTNRNRLKLNPNNHNNSYIGTGTYVTPGGANDYNYYQVPSGVINENVTLNFNLFNLTIFYKYKGSVGGTTVESSVGGQIGIILFINGESFSVQQFSLTSNELSNSSPNQTLFKNLGNVSFSIPAGEIIAGDEISIEYVVEAEFDALNYYVENGFFQSGIGNPEGSFTSYSVTQVPIPTLPITIGNNNIWGYYDKTNYPYVITSSDAVSESLGMLYGNSNVKQTDIPDSGFESIALPWSIKYGDEFRFEGDERFTYMVGEVYGPNEGSGSRITPTGSIEVQFDKNLPVSANISSFNLDHFLIRRYVDDPSQIIFEGFRPLQSQGPYILTPEFSTAKLNINIDDVITNLKERGLITGEEGT